MSTPTSSPGRTVGGRYALLATIGAGGMGTVWRAHDQVLRRDVAVKEVLLPPGVPRVERQLLCERTLREARAAASLNHPSVIRIYDVVEEGDRPWIIMELVAARSLAEIIRDGGPQRPQVVADVGLQVLDALEAAHAAGILHRDVKPGNILLSADGRATLTDFGVARSSGDSALTSTGLLLGSPAYIPPERARGQPAVPASDLWSLGATLYAAVEGCPPYDKGDPLPTLSAIVSEPPRPFSLAGPLEPVLTGLLERDPERRWDVRRARDAFRDCLSSSRAEATRKVVAPNRLGAPAASPSPHNARQTNAGRRVLLVALIVVLAGVAAVGTFLLTRQPTGTVSTTASRSPATTITTPAGFFRFQHPDGFSVAVPDNWKQETLPSGIIQFRDPADTAGGGRFLRLQAVKTDSPGMATYFKEADKRTSLSLQGYQLVGISPSKAGTRDSADWEFTHTLEANRHVIVRGFIHNGRVFTFYVSTREDQFATTKDIVGTVAASFDVKG